MQDKRLRQFDAPRKYGAGSGWIYDARGHVVTANHVIDGADAIHVRFFDGTERTATVVGADPLTDIAVLEVDAGNRSERSPLSSTTIDASPGARSATTTA